MIGSVRFVLIFYPSEELVSSRDSCLQDFVNIALKMSRLSDSGSFLWYVYPIKAGSHFSRPIFLKLAGNLKDGKKQKSTFLFFFEMKNNEDIRDRIFPNFFLRCRFFWHQVDQISTLYRNQYRESNSIEMFGLSLTVLS
jgi:hypothetical protein